MSLKIYSAAEHTIVFGVKPLESGRGDDEFVSYEQDQPNFSVKVGVDGESTRSENKNTYTVAKLTLMQTSEYNGYLSAILNGDIAAPGGAGVMPFLVRDRQGTTMLMTIEAFILGPPAVKRAKEVGTNEWSIGLISPTRYDGGS